MNLGRSSRFFAPERALALIALAGACAQVPPRDRCRGHTAEIKAIFNADQADRTDSSGNPKVDIDWKKISPRDAQRLRRIKEIAAEGCLRSKDDYFEAALVSQHGPTPDDYLRTYSWARKSISLGRKKAASLMAMAADRYLMNTGRRQIYASQATLRDGCFCLWPVEDSATDEDRRKMNRPSLAAQLDWIDSLNAQADKVSCPKRAICADAAKPVSRGSLPDLGW